jgi:hypothetical protein
MILWFVKIMHSCTLFGRWFLTSAQQMFLLILPSKGSWVKEKGTIEIMYIAKLKDGPKRLKKAFSIILERVFEMV